MLGGCIVGIPPRFQGFGAVIEFAVFRAQGDEAEAHFFACFTAQFNVALIPFRRQCGLIAIAVRLTAVIGIATL